MARVKNPHDIYAKRIFRQIPLARDFFQHYLPANLVAVLDLEQLTLDEGAFADKRLRQHFSDLLFRVPLRTGGTTYLQLLLEHKSAPASRVAVQLLRYVAHILASIDDSDDLPPIIPVVIYHGHDKWNIAQNLGALFKLPPELAVVRPYLPEFSFHLCDLTAYNDGALVGSNALQAQLLLLKHIFGKDLAKILPNLLRRLLTALPTDDPTEQLEAAMWYLQSGAKISQRQTGDALMQALNESEDKTMELRVSPRFWERISRQISRAKGRQEGLEEGNKRLTSLTLMLTEKKFGPLDENLTAQITLLPAPKLTDLSLALLDFQQPQDLTDWLAQATSKPNETDDINN